MGILDTDLAAIFADPLMSVSVRYGVQRTTGFLDRPTETYADGSGMPAQVAAIVLTYQASTLTGVTQNTTITVDGTDYVIRSVVRDDDGRTARLLLAEED